MSKLSSAFFLLGKVNCYRNTKKLRAFVHAAIDKVTPRNSKRTRTLILNAWAEELINRNSRREGERATTHRLTEAWAPLCSRSSGTYNYPPFIFKMNTNELVHSGML